MTTHEIMAIPPAIPLEGFVRTKQVLQMFPIGRTTLWRKIRAGKFPKPRKLGPKTSVWDVAELRALKDSIMREDGNEQF
ncbi:helix-turn-helix transcriptional regulator [Desulfovibrio falkowii]|uniref:Phage transcriptional regulator, AlpA n=2 Tax=Desulfovibrio TaxID=872 RepID=B8J053_DESDA